VPVLHLSVHWDFCLVLTLLYLSWLAFDGQETPKRAFPDSVEGINRLTLIDKLSKLD
jgi:hypothetical protein